MTYNGEVGCSIGRLFKNGDNKTVKDGSDHFVIEILAVNNYNDPINEITKEKMGNAFIMHAGY